MSTGQDDQFDAGVAPGAAPSGATEPGSERPRVPPEEGARARDDGVSTFVPGVLEGGPELPASLFTPVVDNAKHREQLARGLRSTRPFRAFAAERAKSSNARATDERFDAANAACALARARSVLSHFIHSNAKPTKLRRKIRMEPVGVNKAKKRLARLRLGVGDGGRHIFKFSPKSDEHTVEAVAAMLSAMKAAVAHQPRLLHRFVDAGETLLHAVHPNTKRVSDADAMTAAALALVVCETAPEVLTRAARAMGKLPAADLKALQEAHADEGEQRGGGLVDLAKGGAQGFASAFGRGVDRFAASAGWLGALAAPLGIYALVGGGTNQGGVTAATQILTATAALGGAAAVARAAQNSKGTQRQQELLEAHQAHLGYDSAELRRLMAEQANVMQQLQAAEYVSDDDEDENDSDEEEFNEGPGSGDE